MEHDLPRDRRTTPSAGISRLRGDRWHHRGPSSTRDAHRVRGHDRGAGGAEHGGGNLDTSVLGAAVPEARGASGGLGGAGRAYD